MEVNRELPNLADGLDDSVHLVGPNGRILVLAYHSLEDRLVKERFNAWAGEPTGARARTGLPVEPPAPSALARRPHPTCGRGPSAAEVAANPRAESARLRAVERAPRHGSVSAAAVAAHRHGHARPGLAAPACRPAPSPPRRPAAPPCRPPGAASAPPAPARRPRGGRAPWSCCSRSSSCNVWLAQSQLTLDQLNGRVDAAQRAYQQALLAARPGRVAVPDHRPSGPARARGPEPAGRRGAGPRPRHRDARPVHGRHPGAVNPPRSVSARARPTPTRVRRLGRPPARPAVAPPRAHRAPRPASHDRSHHAPAPHGAHRTTPAPAARSW